MDVNSINGGASVTDFRLAPKARYWPFSTLRFLIFRVI